MNIPERPQELGNDTNHKHALTLLETAVTTALTALTLAAMATTLQAAKNQSRSDVCLTNLKALGNAIYTYAAEYNNVLPGPAYPGLSHHQTIQDYIEHGYSTTSAEHEINRRLTTLLKNVLGNNRTDQQITCPTMAAIIPDEHFERFEYLAEYGYWVWPTHYTLNNFCNEPADAGDAGGSTAPPSVRITSPANYFGYSPYLGAYDIPTSPQPLARIANASQEWMIADAWHRPRNNHALQFLQREGPYQSYYSGEPLPNFAPHMRRAGQTFTYIDRRTRTYESHRIRSAKSDGLTNSIFFDGHAAPVPSRTATINGYTAFYGFPGTVNNYFRTPSEQNYWNMIIWE